MRRGSTTVPNPARFGPLAPQVNWKYGPVTNSTYPLDKLESVLKVIIDHERIDTLYESRLLRKLVDRKWAVFAKRVFHQRFVAVALALVFYHLSLRLHPRFVAHGGLRHCGPCASSGPAAPAGATPLFGTGVAESETALDPACWVLNGLVLILGDNGSETLFPPSSSSFSSCYGIEDKWLLFAWIVCQIILVTGALYKLSVEISEARARTRLEHRRLLPFTCNFLLTQVLLHGLRAHLKEAGGALFVENVVSFTASVSTVASFVLRGFLLTRPFEESWPVRTSRNKGYSNLFCHGGDNITDNSSSRFLYRRWSSPRHLT